MAENNRQGQETVAYNSFKRDHFELELTVTLMKIRQEHFDDELRVFVPELSLKGN